ncbi:UNKNOWN [Stylonychia lemnae]|uniref:Uncharacterized protein n=1 Tax=Stylonychia lemnae TaxID=5949 RepID=A0A078ASM3_STYLE|nr:UNKNOWN [Stylonychia lemnae]|eukprot:CDW85174.1 UNKNOWN [Stylonychia lemnae]
MDIDLKIKKTWMQLDQEYMMMAADTPSIDYSTNLKSQPDQALESFNKEPDSYKTSDEITGWGGTHHNFNQSPGKGHRNSETKKDNFLDYLKATKIQRDSNFYHRSDGGMVSKSFD